MPATNMRLRIYRISRYLKAIICLALITTFLSLYVFEPYPVSAAGYDVRLNIINTANLQLGKSYSQDQDKRLGPNYFDCSGLVWYCYTNSGVTVTNTVADWIAYPIDRGDLLPGDLVYMDFQTRPSHIYPTGYHVGIYIGNNEVIDARGSTSGVVRRSINDLNWTWFGRVPAEHWPNNDNGVTYSISDQDYIRALYQLLLDREPDQTGFESWLKAADDGMPRYDMAQAFFSSHDYHDYFVSSLYMDILGRQDCGDGIDVWAKAMDDGIKERDLRSRFLGTDEYLMTLPAPTNQWYVVSLYQKILGRSPAGGEEAGWVTLLDNNLYSRGSVAFMLMSTREGLARFIRTAYAKIILSVSETGVASWLTTMEAGADERVVMAAMYGSGDFVNGYMNSKNFIRSIYVRLLGRQADTLGLNLWTQAMNEGMSRYAVSAAFLASSENHRYTVDRLYQDILSRPADIGGVDSWASLLDRGVCRREVQANLYGSDEFFHRVITNPTNQDYVVALYERILERVPGTEELTAWVGLLNSGGSRKDVAYGILSSQEHYRDFVNACYSDILGRNPSSAETGQWVGAMIAGFTEERLEAGFYSSPEYPVSF